MNTMEEELTESTMTPASSEAVQENNINEAVALIPEPETKSENEQAMSKIDETTDVNESPVITENNLNSSMDAETSANEGQLLIDTSMEDESDSQVDKVSSENVEESNVETKEAKSVQLETVSPVNVEQKTELTTVPESPKSENEDIRRRKMTRELMQLKRSAAESKIISEFNNTTEKMRSRKTINYQKLDDSPSRSRSSESGRKSADLNLNESGRGSADLHKQTDEPKTPKSTKKTKLETKSPDQKRSMRSQNNKADASDIFCWQCHKDGVTISCKTCPRSFHSRCVKSSDAEDWYCPECLAIIQAETTDTRSPAMKQMSLSHLCELLKFALQRMMDYIGAEPFLNPVDIGEFPDYTEYVVHPMDLSQLEHNIKKNSYGSTEAFIADTKWILHNSVIYNSFRTKLTTVAKGIIKICKQEMNEIETCHECYLKANTRYETSWFLEVCSQPHMLVWAKLKGYPYWPAKAMTVSMNGLVDVRFFGAHDKAWIPIKDVMLYSEREPNFNDKGKRADFVESMKELTIYIKNLEKKFGKFHHAPFKTPYTTDQAAIYNMMLPSYKYKESENKNMNIKQFKSPNKTRKVKTKATTNLESSNASKSAEEVDDDSIMAGYGTEEDEEMPNLSEFKRYPDSSDTDNNTSLKISPLRGNVRMRGGKTNSTGKIKVLRVAKTEAKSEDDSCPKLSPQKDLTEINITADVKKLKTSVEGMDVDETIDKNEDLNKEQGVKNSLRKKNVVVKTDITKLSTDKLGSMNNVDKTTSNAKENNATNNDLNKNPLKALDKLPQITIKDFTLHSSDAKLLKNNGMKDKSFDKKAVIIRKRSHNSSSKNNTSDQTSDPTSKNSNDVEASSNKRARMNQDKNKNSISLENLEQFEKNINSMSSPTSTISSKQDDSTPNILTEIKTEPLDEDEIKTNPTKPTPNSAKPNETTNKKQSARKSFPSKPTSNKTIIKKVYTTKNVGPNPISMVYIPHTEVTTPVKNSVPKVSETVSSTIPLNYQLPLSGVGTVTTSRSYDVTATTATKNSLLMSMSCRESTSVSVVNTSSDGQAQVANPVIQQSPVAPQPVIQTNRPLLGPLSTPLPTALPSECGPVTKLLNESASKLSDYFRSLMQETLTDFSNAGSAEALARRLQVEIESLKWLHRQEVSELKHNTEIILWEMRTSYELANARNLAECRKLADAETLRCVQEAKRKQWCVNCGKEAQFYCCWNTSYCGYDCQKEHWNNHMTFCGQFRDGPHEEKSPAHTTNDGKSKITPKGFSNRGQPLKGTPKLHKQNISAIPRKPITSTPINKAQLTLVRKSGQRNFELINTSNIKSDTNQTSKKTNIGINHTLNTT